MIYDIYIMSLSKKQIPLAVFIIIFVVIIGIAIIIATGGVQTSSPSDPLTATTTIFGIPVPNQISVPTPQKANQYITSDSQPPATGYTPPQNIPIETQIVKAQAAFTVLYPTNNQTLINDPTYNTPLAIIRWSSKFASIKNVNLDLQDQNGTFIKTIATHTANSGTYVWFSGAEIPNGTYRIRIHAPIIGTTIDEGISDLFSITSPASLQHPDTSWHTYINPQYKFSFIYPGDFLFSTFNTQYPGTTIVKISPKLNYYIHANDIETVDASDILISARPAGSSACPSVAETTGAQGYVYGNMDTIQGKYVQFTKVKRNDFGINNQHARYVDYFTLHNGVCYSFRFTAHVVRLPFSTNALYQAPDKLENDISRMTANVEQMVLSLEFLQ